MKEQNEKILNERTANYNKCDGVRVGDFLKSHAGDYFRFSHDWGIDIQTCRDGSFYLGKNHTEYSGGLAGAIEKDLMHQLDETKAGRFWFFNNNEARAHNGHDVMVDCRVFQIIDPEIEQNYLYNNRYSLGIDK